VWRSLDWPHELVEFYDPVDLFADLADALAEAHPSAGGPDPEGAGGTSSRP
jgi:hypothetical protein